MMFLRTLGTIAAFFLLGAPAHAQTTWTGFYAGAHAGYDFGNVKISAGPFAIDGLAATGPAGGVHAGYDVQIPGTAIVLGAGAEYSWSGASFDVSPGLLKAELQSAWGLYGRAGFAVGDIMPFVLAGYTQADAKASAGGGSVGETMKGWFGGAGLEWRLAPTVSVTAEYRFTRFDSIDLGGVAALDTDMHSVRMGVNVRLGGGAFEPLK